MPLKQQPSWDWIPDRLIGREVARPNSRTLSGHAAGGAFERIVAELLQQEWKDCCFLQSDYLNRLYAANPQAKTAAERWALVPAESLRLLVNRGEKVTQEWSANNMFKEKQNDTADLVVEGVPPKIHIVDVKTKNLNIKGQPPNIISSLKLATMAASMIDHKDQDSFDIVYVGVSWEEVQGSLVCKAASAIDLFKINPSSLYINWSAALQIQFHIQDVGQDYSSDRSKWAKDFLVHFVDGAKRRVAKMESDWIKKFSAYID